MSTSVCTLDWDGATGTPRPFPTQTQAQAYATTAKAFRWTNPMPTSGGALVVWQDCTKAQADARLAVLGSHVGKQTSVVYPHGTIPRLWLASYTGAWQAQAGTVNGGVLTVQLHFDAAASRQTGPDAPQSVALVQTAVALHTADGSWTTRPWETDSAARGVGAYLGEALAWQDGAAPDYTVAGMWCRIVKRDPTTGGVASPLVIYWRGKVAGVRVSRLESGGARVQYRMAGMLHALNQCHLSEWYESRNTDWPGWVDTSNAVANVGQPLDFNAGGRGDMSVAAHVLPSGAVCRVHARGERTTPGAVGVRWTAKRAVETILAHIRHCWGFQVGLDFPDNLDYDGQWDWQGRNPLAMIAAIISPDTGRTFLESVVGGVLTLTVVDMETIPDPAPPALDLTADGVQEWAVDQDHTMVEDTHYVQAPQPIWMRTIAADDVLTWATRPTGDALEPWYTEADQTAWDASSDEARKSPPLDAVFRAWQLFARWDTRAYSGLTRIPYKRTVQAGPPEAGGGQETGELESLPAAEYPNARVAWKMSRLVPLAPGKDWTDPYVVTSNLDPVEGPLMYWYKPIATPPWVVAHQDFQIQVGDDGGSIIVGRTPADAAAIKARLAAGWTPVFTVALVHPLAFRVSATTEAVGGSPPCTDLRRSGCTYLTGDYWTQVRVPDRTVFKLDASSAAVLAAEGRRDQGGDPVAFRDKMRTWWLSPDGTATWTVRGIADDAGAMLATMVDQATVRWGADEGDTASVAVRAPVVRVSFDFRAASASVSYQASRTLAGFRVPSVVQGALGVGLARGQYQSSGGA